MKYYRLSDAVRGYNFTNTREARHFFNFYYKDTLAAEYLRKASKFNDMGILCNLSEARARGRWMNETLVHLRLGDAIDGKEDVGRSAVDLWTHGGNRKSSTGHVYVKSKAYYEEAVRRMGAGGRLTIVSSLEHSHHGANGIAYREQARLFFEQFYTVTMANTGNADDDFSRMATSARFVMGGGGFSKKASLCVDMLGGEVVMPYIESGRYHN